MSITDIYYVHVDSPNEDGETTLDAMIING